MTEAEPTAMPDRPPPSPPRAARGGGPRPRPGNATALFLAALASSTCGCLPDEGSRLVIATPWPRSARVELESAYRRASGDTLPITWVATGPGERPSAVLGRRGGVDLILGGPIDEFGRLAEAGKIAPWRIVNRPAHDPGGPPDEGGDPRDDPMALARARSLLAGPGWAAGYEELVRQAAGAGPTPGPDGPSRPSNRVDRLEGAAEALDGRSRERARRFLDRIGARPGAEALGPDPNIRAAADGLLADLLGAALVDAREELRDAASALRRFHHPAKAEAALGERPPWPPASVARLREGPSGAPLLDTLLEQVAPDPESRRWLRESWSRPRRGVDGALLIELAGAVDGRLAREPRFRAWLRGEWGAWTRQLYRRVARVAGGYVPS